MWRLDKPDLEAAKKDIPRLIESDNRLVESDKAVLEELYDLYESHHGCVTNEEHDRIPLEKQEALESLYEKTYSSRSLNDIRSSLMDPVDKCPYCSINEPTELDHYMPRSRYKALSVCRLNLVPMCGVCNRKKSDKPYAGFVHPYYFAEPGAPEFLVVTVTVIDKQVSFDLSVSPNVEDDRKKVLENQIRELDLKSRLHKEMSSYLFDLLLFQKKPLQTDEALKEFLEHCLSCLSTSRIDYGGNYWRTALLRGLIACKGFTAEVARNHVCQRTSR